MAHHGLDVEHGQDELGFPRLRAGPGRLEPGVARRPRGGRPQGSGMGVRRCPDPRALAPLFSTASSFASRSWQGHLTRGSGRSRLRRERKKTMRDSGDPRAPRGPSASTVQSSRAQTRRSQVPFPIRSHCQASWEPRAPVSDLSRYRCSGRRTLAGHPHGDRGEGGRSWLSATVVLQPPALSPSARPGMAPRSRTPILRGCPSPAHRS